LPLKVVGVLPSRCLVQDNWTVWWQEASRSKVLKVLKMIKMIKVIKVMNF
jgi:hypothetical protein